VAGVNPSISHMWMIPPGKSFLGDLCAARDCVLAKSLIPFRKRNRRDRDSPSSDWPGDAVSGRADCRKKVSTELIIPGRDPLEVLKAAEGVLDQMPLPVTNFAVGDLPLAVGSTNRRAHSRMLRDQLFGTLATLAVIDGISPSAFAALAYAHLRSRLLPQCFQRVAGTAAAGQRKGAKSLTWRLNIGCGGRI